MTLDDERKTLRSELRECCFELGVGIRHDTDLLDRLTSVQGADGFDAQAPRFPGHHILRND